VIRVENLNVDLGEFSLENIDISVDKNQFFVLMGPTGAGKTVLLEAIAGLVPVKSGKVIIGNRDVTRLPPEKRGISIVYQDYALFPHLTVYNNIIYGLHFHRVEKREYRRRIDELVRQLDLNHLLHRYPTTLSGGELQRVALARALIIYPDILLLDEPLSALDPGFREEIRLHLKRLHKTSGSTFIMVTHDFADAIALADKASVINNGRIEQTGEMSDIFERPCSTFVADFVGIRNIFPVTYEKTKAAVDDLKIETGREWPQDQGYIAIRPEDVVVSTSPLSSSMRNCFQGRVSAVFNKGFFYDVEVKVGSTAFSSLITKKSLFDLRIHEGMEIYIAFKATAIHAF
jgi:molybdate/tungstate transport system ATP-binding protein